MNSLLVLFAFVTTSFCEEQFDDFQSGDEEYPTEPPTGLYPDLSCWPGYKAGKLEKINAECRGDQEVFKKQNKWSVPCFKACAILQLTNVRYTKKGLINEAREKYPAYLYKFFGLNKQGRGKYSKKDLQKKNDSIYKLTDPLLNCLENAHFPYNNQVDCKKWGPIYECVERATTCQGGRGFLSFLKWAMKSIAQIFGMSKEEMDYLDRDYSDEEKKEIEEMKRKATTPAPS